MLTAVVTPGTLFYCQRCFPCPKHCFPDFTGGKNPIHFANLNSSINCSMKKFLMLSIVVFPSLIAYGTWYIHLFSYLSHCLISICMSCSPNGRSP